VTQREEIQRPLKGVNSQDVRRLTQIIELKKEAMNLLFYYTAIFKKSTEFTPL
jgi:hypothetical protein